MTQDQWEEGNLRKKITVTTLNLSIEALVWKLKTFYLSAHFSTLSVDKE